MHSLFTRAIKGAGSLVLYLDFDGVLHHENCLWHPRRGPFLKAPKGHILFQHADLLAQILSPYPQVKIVQRTSWVRSYGCHGAAKRLPLTLRERVIGGTFHSRMNENEFVAAPRSMQVWGDVSRRKPQDWMALDDGYLHWPAWCRKNYIQTPEVEGIGDPDTCKKIIQRLAQMCA